MLTFLAVACKKKFVLDEYSDEAVGHMEKNENGKLAITRVNCIRRSIFRRETADRAGTRRNAPFRPHRMFHRELGEDEGHGREITRLLDSRSINAVIRVSSRLRVRSSRRPSARSAAQCIAMSARPIHSGWRRSSACASGGVHFPIERDLRRAEWLLGLRAARRRAEAECEGLLVAHHGPRTGRRRRHGRRDSDEPRRLESERTRGNLHRSDGRLPDVQGATAGRSAAGKKRRQAMSELRRKRSDGTARV